MQHRIVIHNLSEIDQAAAQFLEELGPGRIIAFYAPMGAGKTTFTTAICRVLGVKGDAVSSPTFAIVNEYRAASGESIYHLPREGGKARVAHAGNAAVGVGSSLTVEAEIEYVADFETVAKNCHVTVRGH